MRKLKYILQDFYWLKVLNSPFKPFKVSFYVGKTRIGVPYFLPRKWVKFNNQDIQKAIEEHKANKNKVLVSDAQLYDMYYNYKKAVPLKVGFSYCSLGWKTKWTDCDYRYEWGPVLSFVFFGYQIAVMVGFRDKNKNAVDHYWEAWLFYENNTDKTKSKKERVKQCRDEFPMVWTKSSVRGKERIDYYDIVLKEKYK
jgi:hypothetical protein